MPRPVIQISVEDEIRRVSAEVRELERQHGRSSASMLEAVRSGAVRSTGDICDWLTIYDYLKTLEGIAGREAGSPTSATASSTKTASRP